MEYWDAICDELSHDARRWVERTVVTEGTIRISHWTTLENGFRILKDWMEGSQEHDGVIRLRMNAGLGTNDPGEHTWDPARFMTSRSGKLQRLFPSGAFMMSWAESDGKKKETDDRLEFWRAYGNGGHGMCLTCSWKVGKLWEQRVGVIRVQYADDARLRVEEIDRELAEMKNKSVLPAKLSAVRWHNDVEELRVMLNRSFKTSDWAREHEVRLVHVATEEELVPKELRIWVANGWARLGITVPVKRNCLEKVEQVTLGPLVGDERVKSNRNLIEWMLTRMGYSGIPVSKSELRMA